MELLLRSVDPTLISDGDPLESLALVQSDAVNKYIAIACLCLALWEYLITLDDEIKYIWQRRPIMTWVNGLFLWNRYFATFSIIFLVYSSFVSYEQYDFCRMAAPWVVYSAIVNAHVGQGLLMIRLWALYDRSRTVYMFLLGLFVTSITISFIAGSAGVGDLDPRPWFVPKTIHGCFIGVKTTWIIYVNNLAVESALFVLTLICVSQSAQLKDGLKTTPIALHVLRSGALYYFVIMTALAISITGFFYYKLAAFTVSPLICTTVMSIACSRSVLSMRAQLKTQLDPSPVSIKYFPFGNVSDPDLPRPGMLAMPFRYHSRRQQMEYSNEGVRELLLPRSHNASISEMGGIGESPGRPGVRPASWRSWFSGGRRR